MKTDNNPENRDNKKFTLQSPSISLPKGGGSIRGIGEKFSANLVTGTGSLNVPLFTSPGRSGFGPQLSLSYDTTAGNGPFGFGWNLSLPSITRKTDKGLPQYKDEEESDTFILSGSEDLVPVLKQNIDGSWQIDSTTRTINNARYHIQPYRPRIEGLFAKIERWTNLQTGETHWRSISKDNITTIYGLTSNSRITDPTDSARIFSWLICESYDDNGHAVLYNYKEENSQRVTDLSLLNEKNRTPTTRATNRYLKRIKYGNKTPRNYDEDLTTRTDWLFEVVFDYGEHYMEQTQDPNIITVSFDDNSREWPIRKDPFSLYRSCFEVRTYRLCHRVLMFHHFPNELDTDNYLVRSTDFTYDQQPIASYITKITQSGYIRKSNGTYQKKSFPPVELEYSPRTIHKEVKEVDAKSLENLPIGLDGGIYQWVDIDGEGLSGILTQEGGNTCWLYKRNQSALLWSDNKNNGSKQSPEARFAPIEKISSIPSLANIHSGKQQFLDLAGDGQLDLVHFEDSQSGFFERTQDGKWESFIPFSFIPHISWNDPNLKFVDLTGDGHTDILITEEDYVFTWYQSLAEKGFAKAEKIRQSMDEEKGPRLVFADSTESIFLADVSGDGMIDLVRIRNGEVCYWPNLGYGRFGAKVTMDNPPLFDDSTNIFDQRRIRLADIDGSGVTDIIYIGSNGVSIYFNESGNRWSDKQKLELFPNVDNLSTVMIVDLFGNGTTCLVWSSPLSGNTLNPMRYIDLMGSHKPHLLIAISNNMGAKTEIEYAPSTKFYLKDMLDGKTWITRLPFPVHVVERVKTFDLISKNLFVTHYAYHHGYFDGIEREFRGFGMVEQWDTEEYATLNAMVDSLSSSTNIEESSHVPPVLTKTWFHTGIYLGREHVSNFFAGFVNVNDKGEYYREPEWYDDDEETRKHLLDDTMLPKELMVEEEAEACRSLKGSMLRQEIYALDGTDKEKHPYTIIEQNFAIKRLQPRSKNQYAVFFTHNLEAITYHYEREYNLPAPRISHVLTLEVDDFGNVLKQVSIGYGRTQSDPSLLMPRDHNKQTKLLITYTENNFTNNIDDIDNYRVPLPCESLTYELTGYNPTGHAGRFQHLDFVQSIQQDPAKPEKIVHIFDKEIKYEDSASNGRQRRMIEHVRTLYRNNNLTNLLALGQLTSLALQGETFKLAFTPGLLEKVYQRGLNGQPSEILLSNPATMLEGEGKYLLSQNLKTLGVFPDTDLDDHWWIPSGRVFYISENVDAGKELAYAKQHFFLPRRYIDPFGNSSTVTFDNYDLLMVETHDPLKNTISVKNDYCVLQPYLMTDPNRNQTEVKFDALGMVVGTAIMGKLAPAHREGDSLHDFEVHLTEEHILNHLASPLTTDPHSILRRSTTRLVYDLFAYYRSKDKPIPQPTVVYTLARETHDADLEFGEKTKIKHSFSYWDGFGREIQRKVQAEPGRLDLDDPSAPIVNPRWVGSGWTVFNNKGKPVRQYEPFFSSTHNFEFSQIVGVSPILFYDPVGRVIANLHPNHTYEKTIFHPWSQENWDLNDSVIETDPKNDADIGDYFRRLSDRDYLPTWYVERKDGQQGDIEQNAAKKTTAHANTPTLSYFDPMGRTFLTLADNGEYGKYPTYFDLDIEGNQCKVIDALDRIVMTYDYNMVGTLLHQSSMEAGERWMLHDIMGKIVYQWDSRGYRTRNTYDELHRPNEKFVKENNGPEEKVVERITYGEVKNIKLNHRGKIFQYFDGSGIVTNEEYDFKGNLIKSSRCFAVDYKNTIDWSLQTVSVENNIYTTSTIYDALNRTIQKNYPDNSKIIFIYNEASLLERIIGNLHGENTTTTFVNDIDYNAKGQREIIEYGNGIKTYYEYDPLMFRLKHMKTLRIGEILQDLYYSSDPVGNIVHLRDAAQQNIFVKGRWVEPSTDYKYDAVYRLKEVTGREHLGLANGSPNPPEPTSYNDYSRVGLNLNDPNFLGTYNEDYIYDPSGNIEEVNHTGTNPSNPGWTQSYSYDEDSLIETGKKSNRLSFIKVRDATYSYTYDEHGNMIIMPHLDHSVPNNPNIYWDFKNQLQKVNLGGGGTAYYVYDISGQRTRKVHEHNGNVMEERLYLGNLEVYRKYMGARLPLVLNRETLHIMDDKQRIALVESRTYGNDGSPEQLIRYQLGNYLGSSLLELDHQAQIISYEEYYSYGCTSYQAVRSQTELPLKRYRYIGKERDEESGLYYFGARYYIAWLGRWMNPDPSDIGDDLNLYKYVLDNPLRFIDSGGTNSVEAYNSIEEKRSLQAFVDYSRRNINTTMTYDITYQYPAMRAAPKDMKIIPEYEAQEIMVKKIKEEKEFRENLLTPFGAIFVGLGSLLTNFSLDPTRMKRLAAGGAAVSGLAQGLGKTVKARNEFRAISPIQESPRGRISIQTTPESKPPSTISLENYLPAVPTRLSPTDPPQRYMGPWTKGDLERASRGLPPKEMGRGKLELHHADQMPGSGIHEVSPSEHRQHGIHSNKFKQGVTKEMRKEDRSLYWQLRGEEMGNPSPPYKPNWR